MHSLVSLASSKSRTGVASVISAGCGFLLDIFRELQSVIDSAVLFYHFVRISGPFSTKQLFSLTKFPVIMWHMSPRSVCQFQFSPSRWQDLLLAEYQGAPEMFRSFCLESVQDLHTDTPTSAALRPVLSLEAGGRVW